MHRGDILLDLGDQDETDALYYGHDSASNHYGSDGSDVSDESDVSDDNDSDIDDPEISDMIEDDVSEEAPENQDWESESALSIVEGHSEVDISYSMDLFDLERDVNLDNFIYP